MSRAIETGSRNRRYTHAASPSQASRASRCGERSMGVPTLDKKTTAAKAIA